MKLFICIFPILLLIPLRHDHVLSAVLRSETPSIYFLASECLTKFRTHIEQVKLHFYKFQYQKEYCHVEYDTM
jgi:hypothetical protein